ncbi:MAG TPA: ATP-binding protein [Bacteroidia bacterium]|nr:ATP-binding protein [Bacteroidia bacterium]HQK98106.1 ATP-binding protein [Bacteroidia bacterium]
MKTKLLSNQIRKYLGQEELNNPKVLALIDAVNNSYGHYEKDRELLEKAMDLSSNELNEANTKLRLESEDNKIAIERLKESLKILQDDEPENLRLNVESLSINDLAEIIQAETARRKLAEQKYKANVANLERSNRELDQFAYVVSHDLKAPLRAIASLAEWIEEDLEEKLTPESKSNLELLRGRVLRMESLIHGILAYSKAGKVTGDLKMVDVNKLINDIIDSLNPSPHIKITVDENMPIIEAEETKLYQVLGNLISNSIKYNDKPKGIIQVKYLDLEGICQFTVEDNGPGIEKEYHNRIFMIFQTLSARDQVESTGIGLSIVKKIVEEQGGKIWIESEPGQGAKFIFTWPAPVKIKNKSLA